MSSVTAATRLTTSTRTVVLAWVERRLGLTPVGVGVVVSSVLGLALGRVIGSRALYLLVYGAVATVGVAYLLGRRSLDVESTRSDLATRVREGQTIDVSVTLRAKRRVSTIVLEEDVPSSFGTARRLAVPVLPAGEELTHTYRVVPSLRGVYDLGPLVAEWSDPFGLTKRRATLLDPVRLIVHPRTEGAADRVSSRAWEDPPVRPPISRPWPSGFDFYGMRDYVYGDDPRRIVWRATARTLDLDSGAGRYLVWEAEQGITDRVNIIVDSDREHHGSGVPSETFETLVRAAASLGTKHLDDGFSVSVEVNGGTVASHLRGRRSHIDLLDGLAAVQPERERLSTAIERLFLRADRSVHNVVMTPHLDQTSASRLRLLLERGMSLMIVLLVTEDTDPYVIHRAGSLGCNVVEIQVARPLAPAFRRVVGAGRS